MEIKLKSISRQIPWFLVVRSVFFIAGWLYLPFWLFLALSLYLYLSPIFQSLALLLPFLSLLALSALGPQNLWFATILFLTFFILLGIKELFFIDRKAAYETLILLILFASFVLFFFHFSDWTSSSALLWDFLISIAFFLLTKSMVRYLEKNGIHFFEGFSEREKKIKQSVFIGITALLTWQFALIILFLSISFFYQSALLFFITAILLEVILDDMNGELTRRRLMLNLSFLFICIVFVLAASDWTL